MIPEADPSLILKDSDEVMNSNNKNIKVGVIGLGVGEQHIIAYNRELNTQVLAVCDIDPAKLKEVADRQGIRERHTDWRKITENPDIDVVSICSYDDVHAQQCISAFNNGKHVLVEKPVALFRKDAVAILRAQQDSGLKITSNLILRQVPRFIELRQQIQAGEFGEIFCIEGDYIHEILWKILTGWRGKMDFYCTIFGGGIHLIDLMRWVIGYEVTEVTGMGSKILTRDSDYKYDDTYIHILRFENGALGKSLTTFGPRRTKFHSLNVYGTKKTFINDIPNAKTFTSDHPDSECVVTTPYPGVAKGDLIPDFISAIRNNREPNVSAIDVFRIMDTCFAALESANEGRAVPVSFMI